MNVRTIGATLAAGTIALVASPPAGAQLGAAWHLDEGTGAIAADASGNDNHGSVSGAAWTAGRFSSGLRFDGDGDRVHVTRSPSLEPAAVTVEGWVRAEQSPGTFKHIASVGASSCRNASYGLYTGEGGGIAFYVAGGFEVYTISPEAGAEVWDGAWHHVAGTYDGSVVRLYVDGVQVGTGSPSSLAIAYGGTDATDFLLGVYAGACPSPLDYAGDLDEIRVWRRALRAGEIAASHDMGAGSADELSVQAVKDDVVVLTGHFDERDDVTISIESGSGTQRIESVSVADGSATCGGFLTSRCDIELSNGGRTAQLRVRRGLTSILDGDAWLRVRLSGGGSVYAEVDLR